MRHMQTNISHSAKVPRAPQSPGYQSFQALLETGEGSGSVFSAPDTLRTGEDSFILPLLPWSQSYQLRVPLGLGTGEDSVITALTNSTLGTGKDSSHLSS